MDSLLVKLQASAAHAKHLQPQDLSPFNGNGAGAHQRSSVDVQSALSAALNAKASPFGLSLKKAAAAPSSSGGLGSPTHSSHTAGTAMPGTPDQYANDPTRGQREAQVAADALMSLVGSSWGGSKSAFKSVSRQTISQAPEPAAPSHLAASPSLTQSGGDSGKSTRDGAHGTEAGQPESPAARRGSLQSTESSPQVHRKRKRSPEPDTPTLSLQGAALFPAAATPHASPSISTRAAVPASPATKRARLESSMMLHHRIAAFAAIIYNARKPAHYPAICVMPAPAAGIAAEINAIVSGTDKVPIETLRRHVTTAATAASPTLAQTAAAAPAASPIVPQRPHSPAPSASPLNSPSFRVPSLHTGHTLGSQGAMAGGFMLRAASSQLPASMPTPRQVASAIMPPAHSWAMSPRVETRNH